jgi:hypothetical protein
MKRVPKTYRRTGSRSLALLVLLLIGATAGAQGLSATALPPFPPPGQLIDLGGWRLHLNCWASTSQPTMILEAGAGNFSVDWRLVGPAAARFARVCSYDRAGLAGAISVDGHEPCINRCGNCISC